MAIISIKKQGNEHRKIVLKDCYRIKDIPEGSLDAIFDIGASVGIFSVLMKMRHPFAKIIAVEPLLEATKVMKDSFYCHGIFLEEKALGNGKPIHFRERGHILDGLCTEKDEGIEIKTITLGDLFDEYRCKLTDKYLLKFNCEGGEKYLIGDKRAEEILYHAKYICFQIHYKSPSTNFDEWLSLEEYEKWMKKIFTNHNITKYYCYNKEGTVQYKIVWKN